MKEVGSNTYGHDDIKIIHGQEGKLLKIGKFCSIAKDVTVFLGANHRVDWFSTYPFGHIHDTTFPKVKKDHGHPATKGDVIIGNDVWLGTGCTIMSGVTIGDGAVVGACSVVTKNVPPYTIVAGNPAKQIRKRFDDVVINKLLELKWWDKTESEINEISDILCSNDIEKLNNIQYTMIRTDILNILIKKYGYKSYLEVGTQDPTSNFNKIDIEHKVSIDPFPRDEVTFIGTSDEYFESIADDVKYDIIFIDGLHHNDQVLKDIQNSLNHLSENGTIVCHDCLPTTEDMQARDDHGREWTGDVWKAIAELRVERIDLDISVVDTDYGCGIIRRGSNVPYETQDSYLTYSHYSFNKHKMLNVISPEQFIQWANSQ